MNVLIAGLNNYLARNIAVRLAEENYQVTCLVRKRKFFYEHVPERYGIELVEGDLFKDRVIPGIHEEMPIAFYFNQSPIHERSIYLNMELLSLQKYMDLLTLSGCKHFIYVTKLIDHQVGRIEEHIRRSGLNYTIVRVSNIIGKGSVLMNIMSKLAKQRIVVATKEFAKSRCQPIAILDVCQYLNCIMLDPQAYGRSFDVGGPEIMTYNEVMRHYLSIIKSKKRMVALPALGSDISSLVARYVYKFERDIAEAFSTSIRHDSLCKENSLYELYPIELTPFKEAIRLATGH